MKAVLAFLILVGVAAYFQHPDFAAQRFPVLQGLGEGSESGLQRELILPSHIRISQASEAFPWILAVSLAFAAGWALWRFGPLAILVGGGLLACHPLLTVALASGESYRLIPLLFLTISLGAFLQPSKASWWTGALVGAAAIGFAHGSLPIVGILGLFGIVTYPAADTPGRDVRRGVALGILVSAILAAGLIGTPIGYTGPSYLENPGVLKGSFLASSLETLLGSDHGLPWLPVQEWTRSAWVILGVCAFLAFVALFRLAEEGRAYGWLLWASLGVGLATLALLNEIPSPTALLPVLIAVSLCVGSLLRPTKKKPSRFVAYARVALLGLPVFLTIQTFEQKRAISNALPALESAKEDANAYYALQFERLRIAERTPREISLTLYRAFIEQGGSFALAFSPERRAHIATSIVDSLLEQSAFDALARSIEMILMHGQPREMELAKRTQANAKDKVTANDAWRHVGRGGDADEVQMSRGKDMLEQSPFGAEEAQAIAASILEMDAPASQADGNLRLDLAYTLFERSRKVLELDPRSAEPLLELGRKYEARDNKIRALTVFEWAVEANPQDPESYAELGRIYAREGEYDFAQRRIEEGLKTKDLPPSLRFQLGRTLFDLPQAREVGIDHMRRALQEDPNDLASRRSLAHCQSLLAELFLSKSDSTKALLMAKESIEYFDGASRAHWVIGRIASQNGRFDEAFESFWKALELGDEREGLVSETLDAGKRWGYRQLFSTEGREGGMETFKRLLQLDAPEEDLAAIRSVVEGGEVSPPQFRDEKGEEELQDIERTRLTDEQKQWAEKTVEVAAQARRHYEDGMRKLLSGLKSEARLDLEKSLELMPSNPFPHLQVGRLDRDSGQIEDAINHFRRAAALSDELKIELPAAHYDLADALDKAGYREEAEELWKSCLDKWPGDEMAVDAVKRLYGGS